MCGCVCNAEEAKRGKLCVIEKEQKQQQKQYPSSCSGSSNNNNGGDHDGTEALKYLFVQIYKETRSNKNIDTRCDESNKFSRKGFYSLPVWPVFMRMEAQLFMGFITNRS